MDRYRRGSFQQAYSPQSNGYRQYGDRGIKKSIFTPQLVNQTHFQAALGVLVRIFKIMVGRAVPNGLQSAAGVMSLPLLSVLMVEPCFQAAHLVVRLHWAVIHRAVPG